MPWERGWGAFAQDTSAAGKRAPQTHTGLPGPRQCLAAPQWSCEDRGDKAQGDSPAISGRGLLLRPEDQIPPLAVPLQCPAGEASRLAGGRVSHRP